MRRKRTIRPRVLISLSHYAKKKHIVPSGLLSTWRPNRGVKESTAHTRLTSGQLE